MVLLTFKPQLLDLIPDMATTHAKIYLPVVPKLECDSKGHISFKQFDTFFRTIGSIPTQLKLQSNNLPESCSGSLLKAVDDIVKLINDISGILMSDVFKNLKSLEQELELKARELMKDIEVFFQKKLVEIISTILGILGIPNPLEIPIPFLDNCVIKDLFTKDGKKKVKAAIAADVEKIKKFFGEDGAWDGTFGIKSIEHEVENLWHKAINWINKFLNDFNYNAIMAIIHALEKIPIIGQAIKALESFVDPTVELDKMFEKAWDKLKADVKKAKEDLLSGKVFEDLGNKLIDQFINTILGISIPFVGTLGDIMGIDLKEEFKKFKIHMKENILHKIKDQWKVTMEKVRRFLHGGLIGKINDILLKAPGWILKQFPIVGKIFKVTQDIVDILTGKNPLTTCDVLNILLKPIFNLGSVIYGMIPDCIQVEQTEYGYSPSSS